MKKITLLFFLLNATFMLAQREVSGVVKDKTGTPLPGVNVQEKGTKNGVSTDSEGSYKLSVNEGATLIFSYIGYNTATRSATTAIINVDLEEETGGQKLDEVVVTGSRTSTRTNTTSALPIDVLSAKDLTSTGQATFDKALQYRIPSFNTVNTPVNDATSLLDPYEIRNMGPSRTLILINGKRKNLSALVYVQTSPGRGETGADISAIPTDAIERVEILRDGASAQYGSDAIAGVMNIILKKNSNTGSATLRTGITSEGDGETFGLTINNGTTVGDSGFVNYTLDFSKTEMANRPGTVDADGEFNYWGGTTAGINTLPDIKNFLSKHPDAGNINGSPETAAAKFVINGGKDINDHTQFYYNAAYVYKKVNSFANYRTPYWRTTTDFPYLASLFGDGTPASYQGYVPSFEGELNDYNATIGYKFEQDGWNADASFTTGGNQQNYTVSNSHNRSQEDLDGDPTTPDFIYAPDPNVYSGPIDFNPGGVGFTHYVGNIDINKRLSDNFSFAFGSEFRTETFEVREGDEASYIGLGADSYQGNRPENSGKFNRYNVGYYLSASLDATKDLLFEGTIRYEDYSDFGNKTVWKLSSRYKFIDDKITLRGSVSTGFRAPTLHQIYTQKVQSSFAAGGIQLEGIINNVSSAARLRGVPSLKAESSTNYTVGIGINPIKNFSATLDYYYISVKDRIVLGDKITFSPGNIQSFFTNAIDTKTSGLDLVANYRNIGLGTGKLAINLSGNYTIENALDGDVRNIASVEAVDQSVFGKTSEALLLTSRPEFKVILGADYEIDKFTFSLNNTVFGPAKFKNADLYDKNLTVEFLTKMVTDLGISYRATDKISLALNVNNLFNVLPEWELKSDGSAGAEAIMNDPATLKNQINDLTFNGRYSQMTYDGSHFSQLGTMMNLSLNYKF
ncbi:TonB-dependent receptor [Flavobacterium taihuense]|uniref:TonB-dependent receptor n=1 Tax=Flavobacterium taihuense TaxID=2857508 RepID=A0ABS6XTS8_9FLAO|nr:TonB-dependent receptor [Flavobacterium taihuense]MBW4360098.1 TonB-dependent receptor [Flavobacterium taihuense]